MSGAATRDVLDRTEWLQRRRRGIGASDMPAILGLSPYRTALDVYMDKRGLAEEQEQTEAMEIGNAAEPMLARLYTNRTGRSIITTQVEISHSVYPFLMATLDGIAGDGRPVEFKTAGGMKAAEIGEAGSDELPADWLVQAHHQLLVADASVLDFGVLTGGFGFKFRTFTVKRSAQWDEMLIEEGATFWDRVLSGKPPASVLPADGRHLKRLLTPDGSQIELDRTSGFDAIAWANLAQTIAELKVQRAELEAKLRQALGNATSAILPDGRLLKRYQTEMPERTHTVKAFTRDYLAITKAPKQ